MTQATVLVAEDDNLIRTIFVEIVKGEGFDVVEADDGQRAFDLVTSRKIDMIISDMKMPVMSGFDLLVAVKKTHPEIPVTVITGFNGEYREDDALAAGADAYITKPFKVADVAETLRRMYQKVQQQAAVVAKQA
ncbi:MAG: response regulator [candidate division Zixibacteria bacterium]|nr:response regulator [candidate division Zixibacteria bacterium]